MAKTLQGVTQLDMSGGENLVVNPYLAGPRQSLRVVNLILDEHGSLRTVDGTLIQSTAPPGEEGNRVVLPVSWRNAAGITRRLATVVRTGGNRLYNRATTPWTLLGTFASAQDTPQVAIFGDLYIQTDGYNTPKKFDGTTFAPLGGGLPGALHLMLHQGSLWAANTAVTTTATDGKSSLRASETTTNNPENWPLANQAFIAKDDGTEITGLGTFTIAESGIAPTAALVVFKERSSYQVTGLFGANIAIQKTKSDMGCIAPRSIQFVSGFGIVRLTHRGFALYDGVDDRLISEEIRPRIFGRDDVTGIDLNNAALAWAGQAQNPPIYFCLVPTAGPALTRAFLFDLVRRAWTTVDFPFPLAAAELIAEANSLPVVFLTDAPAAGRLGAVRRWFAGDTTFDGTPIAWTWRTRPAFAGSPLRPAFFRAVRLDVLAPSNTTLHYSLIFSGNTRVTGLRTQTFAPAAAGGVWDQSAWGQFTWGGGGATQLLGDQPWIDLLVKATSAILELTGTGPVRLRGIEWYVRPEPIRRTRILA